MCTLYANTKGRELIRNLFRVSANRAAAIEPKDAILPSEQGPVIRLEEAFKLCRTYPAARCES